MLFTLLLISIASSEKCLSLSGNEFVQKEVTDGNTAGMICLVDGEYTIAFTDDMAINATFKDFSLNNFDVSPLRIIYDETNNERYINLVPSTPDVDITAEYHIHGSKTIGTKLNTRNRSFNVLSKPIKIELYTTETTQSYAYPFIELGQTTAEPQEFEVTYFSDTPITNFNTYGFFKVAYGNTVFALKDIKVKENGIDKIIESTMQTSLMVNENKLALDLVKTCKYDAENVNNVIVIKSKEDVPVDSSSSSESSTSQSSQSSESSTSSSDSSSTQSSQASSEASSQTSSQTSSSEKSSEHSETSSKPDSTNNNDSDGAILEMITIMFFALFLF
ncbi:hypothetical protein EIN_021010 [Entamoeba invadens IP1]|uniref:hypothetical protein n=1 Tax=Entamoeba invadens IP1 TaxID=370355 RepID=UPI0002C3D190|nr:hypothetical protein EIN_021010 [Entamoeba invadens IP1]ELP90602.1 hypothetical protein EIN_021010 [Entamoeba invadens IP1]|eukprot:XP_004257373.1 hypothetical protein EIN_021010 [Entamoeba invadens IP1]